MPPLCPGLDEAEIKASLNTRMKPFLQLPASQTKSQSFPEKSTCRFLEMYCFENFVALSAFVDHECI